MGCIINACVIALGVNTKIIGRHVSPNLDKNIKERQILLAMNHYTCDATSGCLCARGGTQTRSLVRSRTTTCPSSASDTIVLIIIESMKTHCEYY